MPRPKITGVENVNKVFKRLPQKMLEGIAHALNQGADEIVARALTLAPVDPDGTAHVKDTIHRTGIEVSEGGKKAVVRVIAGDTKETEDAAFRSEFGRAPSDDGHPGHDPQPFMSPAFHSVRKRVRSRVNRAIKKAVKAELAKGKA